MLGIPVSLSLFDSLIDFADSFIVLCTWLSDSRRNHKCTSKSISPVRIFRFGKGRGIERSEESGDQGRKSKRYKARCWGGGRVDEGMTRSVKSLPLANLTSESPT